MKLPSRLAINTIFKKIPTLSASQIVQLGDSIITSPQNIVSIDTKKIINQVSNKTFSIRLLKWIEPYKISGINYSLFYTEVDHNYKIGDRVFIEGGAYDSDNLIISNRYKSGSDGYKVLYVDKCKIVLNIKYTGEYPTNEEAIDNFVKIYVASTQTEFDYYCQTLSMRSDNEYVLNKFEIGLNNFLFLNGTFSITSGNYQLTSFADSLAVTSTFSSLGNSFVVRGSTASSNYFLDITSNVILNDFTEYLNIGYTQSLSGFYNNGKLRIMNGNFSIGYNDFKNEYFYYYDTSISRWKIDKTYLPTIITKQHFRNGVFKGGEYNQGLYGQHEKRIQWNGDNIKWNLGSSLNVDWISGVLNSSVALNDSYFTVFDRVGLPQMRANVINNGGSGYNYIFNTDFYGGDLINGNIFNMAVVYGTYSNVSALENYLTNQGTTFSINIKGGVYYNSDIIFASVSNSTLISSFVSNSILQKCKSVNSEIESSLFLDSTWISDNIVKIQSYEESNISWYSETETVDYKMYKFYLTDTNWLRLREFQNFYFQDLILNIPNQDLLNFFDDKFSIGQYLQTYDIIGSKPERRVLVQLSTKEENRNSPGSIVGLTNSIEPNFDNTLPSIDIFIEGGDDFNYSATSSYPRTFISETIDISKAYILDSDFVSGLFKNSRWITGNYINYNADYSFTQNSGGYTASISSTSSELSLTIENNKRKDILSVGSSASQIAFINGLHYDSTLNVSDPGYNLIKLPDTYKITSLNIGVSNREITLQDISTQSVILNIPTFLDKKYLLTKNSKNRYNYLHPVKFQDSIISSGIFRRAYFENCQFDNSEFDIKDRDFDNIQNKRKLLLSDIIFDNNNNTIKSGVIQYSHFLTGNDKWNNGIFHQGIWNTSTFTYSIGITSSTIFTREQNSFKSGIFRNASWEDGVFDNGLFYRNNSNAAGTTLIYQNTKESYYYDGVDNLLRWSWKNGTFKNGDFEKSNFEDGKFLSGNLYDSDFLTGESIGGNFGKSNIPYSKTRVWSGTFSSVNVINAEFRSQYETGLVGYRNITWQSGIFNSGIFGVYVTSYDPRSSNNSSVWMNGTFNGGEFTDIAEWRNGTFNDGKFTSYFWYESYSPRTPFELNSFTGVSFSWQSGKFNGGQFGTGLTGSNSTWYTGELNGGIFQGRYWKNGIATRGRFNGSATQSTDYLSYNSFIKSFNSDYYGFWQDGFVSKNKDKFIKDEKFYSLLERESTKKKKTPETYFKNMLWYSGTFSSFDAEMENCVWLDGTFQDGYFYKSTFNPYINLIENNYYSPITSSYSIDTILEPGRIYTLRAEIKSNSGSFISSPITTTISGIGIFSGTFSADSKTFSLNISGATISIENLFLYPGDNSGYRITDSCIWENGESNESDFYFSKWNQGVFDSHATSSQGNAWGTIWKDGIVKYMNAYNVFWENGIWKNGNWNGSPFTNIATYSIGTQSSVVVYPGAASDIISNIYSYASQSFNNTGNSVYNNYDQIHMNDTFTSSASEDVLSDPEMIYDFSSGLRSIDQDVSFWTHDTSNPFVGYVNLFFFTFDFYLDYFSDINAIYTQAVLSFPTSNKVYAYDNVGSTRDIFIDDTKTYKIEIHYFGVFDSSTVGPGTIGSITGLPLPSQGFSAPTSLSSKTLNFTVNVGYSSVPFLNGGYSIPYTETISLNSYGDGKFGSTGFKTISLTFKPTQLDSTKFDSQSLSIVRTGFGTDVRLYISRIEVTEVSMQYDSETNNELYPMANILSLTSSIALPTNILYEFNGVESRFGNGQFLSGIWENGIWNEGWREDLTAIWCDNLSTFDGGKNKSYKTNPWTWIFELNVVGDVSSNSPGLLWDGVNEYYFNIGDKVSVGNIVAIDINGNRRLIRDYLTITDIYIDPLLVSSSKLTLQLNINFPIRSIEKDSENHLIYVTRNVWLNGVFLNGKFLNGVWSNGLFKGYPYITEMIDTQWVDGTFKGGLFRGTTDSYIDNVSIVPYNTALIQKFEFYDNNVSGFPYKFKYNSWIDVNYFETSGVNINRINNVYKQTSLGFTTSFIENNFYGYPTVDVLESTSTLRNGFDLNTRTYNLGWKFKEYTNYLENVGEFIDINQYQFINTDTVSAVSGFGVDNLLSNGWTFSYLSQGEGFASASNSIMSNYGSLDSEWLYISGGRSGSQSIPFDDNSNFTVDIFDNENSADIEKLRYSFIEIEAENLKTTSYPIVFYNNYPATYSIAAYSTLFNGSNITIPINQLFTQSVVNQREYFFNKKDLQMLIFSGPTYSLRIKKIRHVETDMIPFTQIADDCIQFKTITTWDTTPAVLNPAGVYVGPPGDPGEDGSDAPGNAFPGVWGQALPIGTFSSVSGWEGNLQIISSSGEPTWDNFYLVFGGEGCLSYINEDIETPYGATAPDINYDDSNFNYLSSVNVTLSDSILKL